jgi:hypothetical protein
MATYPDRLSYAEGGKEIVNHPSHYTSHPSGVECQTIARHMGYNLGNALKYMWRAGLKTEKKIVDLKKAIWYLQDEVAQLELAETKRIEELKAAEVARQQAAPAPAVQPGPFVAPRAG